MLPGTRLEVRRARESPRLTFGVEMGKDAGEEKEAEKMSLEKLLRVCRVGSQGRGMFPEFSRSGNYEKDLPGGAEL
jgi:hypothetical protein